MLKSTVNMHELTATKVDLVEKEIILGIAAYNLVRSIITFAAYNLVRSIITFAARRLSLDPCRISFSRALEAIEANVLSLFYETDSEKLHKFLDDY
ncbi:MAG: hypothetical protein MUF72_23270 [Elainella sp. Prado103]|jgi:hypothetical protein|nr:hypothetical protein [Elainella sp. Prado103]